MFIKFAAFLRKKKYKSDSAKRLETFILIVTKHYSENVAGVGSEKNFPQNLNRIKWVNHTKRVNPISKFGKLREKYI